MEIEQPKYPQPATVDPVDAEFWKLCQDSVLRFQQCSHCDTWRFLPRYMCAKCSSPDYEWKPSGGRGRIFSWTVTYQPFHPAFARDVPYIAAVVELEEGVRMATRLLDCDPEAVELDMPVVLVFKVYRRRIHAFRVSNLPRNKSKANRHLRIGDRKWIWHTAPNTRPSGKKSGRS